MAYFNQEKKAKIAPAIKALLKKYNLKGSLGVHHHSTVVLNIKSGSIDFISNFNGIGAEERAEGYRFTPAKDYIDVNPYWYHEHFNGVAKDFLTEAFAILNTDNYDNSDAQTDYFDRGHYVDLNIGKWNKPYQLTK